MDIDEMVTRDGITLNRYIVTIDGNLIDVKTVAPVYPHLCIRCNHWTTFPTLCLKCIATELKITKMNHEQRQKNNQISSVDLNEKGTQLMSD